MSQGQQSVSDPWRLCERTHISEAELWDSNIHLTTSGYFINRSRLSLTPIGSQRSINDCGVIRTRLPFLDGSLENRLELLS